MIELIYRLIDHPCAKFISITDYTHSQRQLSSIKKYTSYHQVKYNLSNAEFVTFLRDRVAEQEAYADIHRRAAVQCFRSRSTASQCDASADRSRAAA